MAYVPKVVEISPHVRLPYIEQGDRSGIPVILLHGFLDSWQSFEPVLPRLPDAVHVFALTQRGHGDASRPPEGYSVVHFAQDLKAFMDALELPAAIIAGHSMGSAVAQRFAIDFPERTRGLVLIGAASSLASSADARKFWDSTLAQLTDPVDEGLVRGMIESTLVKPVDAQMMERAVRESMKVPAFVWRAVFESRWRREGDFSGELGRIQSPTLIVWGDQDSRYSRSEQERLAQEIPAAALVTYQGAGHLLHWEEPERFSSDLVNFVGRITSGEG
jgi:non-heme chloroperoxidase